MMNVKGKKIFVGLSGGVDSAVSAALLARAGARVVGIFIKGWYPPGMSCPWARDRRDAMRSAARLHIPFQTLDATKQYKKSVIDYLLSEYAAGRTPNPDIMCNRDIKFGVFFEFARAAGADYIATGHYARTARGAGGAGIHFLRGIDSEKDQSYFLWAVPKEALIRTIFPIGEMRKKAVRTYARAHDLPVANKKDSQGICFLGDISIDELLRTEFPIVSGQAFDIDGKEVGRHNGAMLHTLGERIALTDASVGPWYVVAKNVKDNTLTVSHGKKTSSTTPSKITLRLCNWISDPTLSTEIQYRYHGPLVSGRISISQDNGAVFEANNPLPEPVASGQSLVAYHSEECLGGGIIS